jgi:enoyl-CoA hydratase/carnithine racemase
MSDITYAVHDGVATIELDRPRQRNAFTLPMIDTWVRCLESARADDAVRVVVLTGADGAFCAGADLAEIAGSPTPLQTKSVLMEQVHRVALTVEDLDKPLIAAVNGPAVGAGMDMALMCDVRLASSAATFCEGYVKVGLVPGDGGCFYLPRIVGMARALELLWTGDVVDAATALRIGLVSYVHPAESFREEVRRFALRLAAAPPVHSRMIKRATYQSARSDLRTALDLISSHMAVVRSTADAEEALAAFRQRRPARFEGR